MTKRLKIKLVVPKTREELESLVGEIADLKIREREARNRMDAQLKDVRAVYELQLAGLNEALTPKLLQVQAWAEAHEGEFGGKKSLDLVHALIGWRTTPPSLKTLRGWTWKSVLEKLQSGKFWARYIRTKEEVNKEAILAERDALDDKALSEMGVRISQEEEFYVEPKVSELPAREVLEKVA